MTDPLYVPVLTYGGGGGPVQLLMVLLVVAVACVYPWAFSGPPAGPRPACDHLSAAVSCRP